MPPSRLAALPLTAALGLLPWAAYLADSLPDTHTAVHWKLAWTGRYVTLDGRMNDQYPVILSALPM